ncbi:MAG: hypothetical protein ABJL55_17105 [Roseibium sp.]
MNRTPISLLLKQLKRQERNPNFSPQSKIFRELLTRTPGELHGYLEDQIFLKGDIPDLRCAGDDYAHFASWREKAGFVSPDRVSMVFGQKIDDLREEVRDTFDEIVAREAEIVKDIIARCGGPEALAYIEQMHIRAFVI